jgi:hypothetical protein
MSERQKDSSVPGAANTSAITPTPEQTLEVKAADTFAETVKPKKRSPAKVKAEPEAGEEPAKPKRSRSSKPKNVLTEALPGADVQPAESQGQGAAPSSQAEDLPPLPPAPVPTQEGIAFMQQHVAYQTALDQRTELARGRLARPSQATKESPAPAVREPGKSDVRSSDTKAQATGLVRDADATSDAAGAKPSTDKPGKASKENSIEAGPNVRKGQVGEADLQAVHDAEDGRLLRQLLERSRALKERPNATSGAESAAAIAQSDVGTLRMIKDAAARKLGLAVVERNRHEEPDYKVAFDRLAPELTTEAQEANVGKPSSARSSRVLLDKADDEAAKSTAVPDSVRKRFLKVDSDYYFPDRSPAFVDRGARLATRGEHPEVVKALVEIAKERDWNSITVKGSEAFRRAAWMEAVRNGLQVAGYKPTELDLAQVKQREPANRIEPGALREQELAQPMSRQKPVDHALSEKLWAFANDKPTLVVKKYPEMVQAYALLDAARKFAEAHMPGHESQFVAIGKELITQQLRDGKQVIGPKVHPDHIHRSRSGRNKSDTAAERAQQSEVLVRER